MEWEWYGLAGSRIGIWSRRTCDGFGLDSNERTRLSWKLAGKWYTHRLLAWII